MKRAVQIILCISCLGFMGCCFTPAVFLARTFEGRIVDADTGTPIEGVVILGIWRNKYNTAGGIVRTFQDAEETVTDKNGDFVIGGTDILIFKAGYEYDAYYDISWGRKHIIPLKKLTMEERRRQTVPCPPDEARKERIRLIQKEINKDRIEMGFKPINVGR